MIHQASRDLRFSLASAAIYLGLSYTSSAYSQSTPETPPPLMTSASGIAQNSNIVPAISAQIPASAFVTPSTSSVGNFGHILKFSKTRHKHKNRTPFSLFKNGDNSIASEIEMFAGESRVFPAPGVARIAVGNGQVMSASALDNKEVLVFANAVGTSSLFVWNASGQHQRVKVHIVAGETSRFAREVAAFLSAIPNAKTSIIGDKVVVEGDNLTDLDLAKIEELSKRYPQIVNFTNRLGWEQMVLLDVKVVEFPTHELREIGLKWGATGGAAFAGIWAPAHRGGTDGSYQLSGPNNSPIIDPNGGTVAIPSGLNALSVVNMGLSAQLNLMAQDGKAAILAEPQLSARNGAKATFLAGGEYPYTVSTVNGQTVLFKPYGIKLDIQPRVDRNGTIRATIDSEVSSIDPSFTTGAGPALLSRKTNTEFNVKNGETIVLSGLLSRDSSHTIDKVPLLGEIPILGALFRSKRYQNKETELVVFVTPSIMDSQTPELVKRVNQAKERIENDNGGKPAFLPQISSTPAPPIPAQPAPVTPPKAQVAAEEPVTTPSPIQTPAAEKPAALVVTPQAATLNQPVNTSAIATTSNTINPPSRSAAASKTKTARVASKSKTKPKTKAVAKETPKPAVTPPTPQVATAPTPEEPTPVAMETPTPAPTPEPMSSFLTEQTN